MSDNNLETPEIIFMNKIHELTSNADKLIEIYVTTYTTLQALPEELDFPNKQETFELVRLTIDTISGLKVAVSSLTEWTAEVNDHVEEALRTIKNHTKD